MIRGRYREERGGWCSREVRGVYGVGLWKGIRMVWDIVGTRISFSVGNEQGFFFECVLPNLVCLSY